MVSAEWLKKTDLFGSLMKPSSRSYCLIPLKKHSPGGNHLPSGDTANHLYILIQGEVDLTVKAGEEIGMMTSKIEKEGLFRNSFPDGALSL